MLLDNESSKMVSVKPLYLSLILNINLLSNNLKVMLCRSLFYIADYRRSKVLKFQLALVMHQLPLVFSV